MGMGANPKTKGRLLMEIAEEYRLKVSVRNNLILRAIEDHGYTNLNKFSKACEVPIGGLYGLVNLKDAPITTEGEFTKPARLLMEALGACPTDLWTPEQLTMRLKSNSVERELSKEALQIALQSDAKSLLGIPYEGTFNAERAEIVKDVVDSLTPREVGILNVRFGLNDEEELTLEEAAKRFGVHRERIRQIEAKALRKMRHPSISDKLKHLLDEEE
jgi:RNA polymerase sigma factor (sigma-70 family)